jgi:superfamily II DNA or RNA helicase
MFGVIFDWMKACPETLFVGLSATPWARGLGKYYDDLIKAATTAELIAAGYLSPFRVFAPDDPDLSGVRTIAGEFKQDELGVAMDKAKLVGDAIDTWLKRGENRSTICFGVNRAHAEHLCQRFVEAGVAAEYMDGKTTREERERTFDRFRRGETNVICNVGVLVAGIDLDVRCIVDCRPTKSEIVFVQSFGRGLRTAAGKDRLIYLDHAGNALRLGLPTDIHHDRLDDGKPRKSNSAKPERAEPLPRLCECCQAVMPARAKACEACGHVPEAKSLVAHRDGELVELGSKLAAKETPQPVDKRQFYAELKGYAKTHGYKAGWADVNFKERFGHWPEWSWKAGVAPQAPSLKTKNLILQRTIAFARARDMARHVG